MEPLRLLSETRLQELRESVATHRERYESGDFSDLQRANGWSIEIGSVLVDYDALYGLDGTRRTAEGDTSSSLSVYRALRGMTPAIAREERVWVRLTHVECLTYCRERWLAGLTGDELVNAVRLHFFAPTLTGIRDDNAISRLWWNMHIASIADPEDPEGALRLLLKTADIRSNIVERPTTAARKPLVRAIIRAMRRDPWITSTERSFRQFMIVLNRDAGGILFEALPEGEIDSLLNGLSAKARSQLV
jgi:hypothetical protein